MNTKGIKFLAVLAVLAMAFAAFAVIAPAEENDAAPIGNLTVITDNMTVKAAGDLYTAESVSITLADTTAGPDTITVYVYTGATLTVKFQGTNLATLNVQEISKKGVIGDDGKVTIDNDNFVANHTAAIVGGTAGTFEFATSSTGATVSGSITAGTSINFGTAIKVTKNSSLTTNQVPGTWTEATAYNMDYSDTGAGKHTYYMGTVADIITLKVETDTVVAKAGSATVSDGTNSVALALKGENTEVTLTLTADEMTAAGTLGIGSNLTVLEGSFTAADAALKIQAGNASADPTSLTSFITGVVKKDVVLAEADAAKWTYYDKGAEDIVYKAVPTVKDDQIIGMYNILNKNEKFTDSYTLAPFATLTVPEKYTLTIGDKTSEHAYDIDLTVVANSTLDVWGSVKGVSHKIVGDTYLPGINNAGTVDIRKGASITELVITNTGKLIELPNAYEYNQQKVSIDSTQTIDVLSLAGNLIIPKGVTVTVTGMLDLNTYQLTVTGELIIAEGATIAGYDNNGEIQGSIVLTDGTDYGKIKINGVAGKNVPVVIQGQKMVGLTGVSIVKSKTATTVSGELKAVESMDLPELSLDNATISSMTIPTGVIVTIANDSKITGAVEVKGQLVVVNGETLTLKNGASLDVSGILMTGEDAYIKANITDLDKKYVVGDKDLEPADKKLLSLRPGTDAEDNPFYLTGFKFEVVKTEYTEDDLNLYYQRVYISGSLSTTPSITAPGVGSLHAFNLDAESNVFIADWSEFNEPKAGITATINGNLIVEGLYSSVSELKAKNFVGAYYNTGKDETLKFFVTDINTGLWLVDTVNDKTVKVNTIAGYVVDLDDSITFENEQIIQCNSDAGSLVIPEGVVVTVNKGANVAADMIKTIAGKLIVMKGGSCDPAEALYDVTSENAAGDITYCGFQTALDDSQEGDVITITGNVGAPTALQTLTIPTKRTIEVDGSLTIVKSLVVSADASLIVNGDFTFGTIATKSSKITVVGTMDVSGAKTCTLNGYDAATTDYNLQVVSTGKFIYKESKIAGDAADYTLVGAVYKDGINSVLSNVATAIENGAKTVVISEDYTDLTPIELKGATLTVADGKKASFGTIDAKDGTIVADGSITATVNGIDGADIATQLTLAEFKGTIANKAKADVYTVDIMDMKNGSSLTVVSGVVSVSADTIVIGDKKSFNVNAGAGLVSEGVVDFQNAGTMTLAGTIYVKDGNMTVSQAGKLTISGDMYVGDIAAVAINAATISGDIYLEGNMTINGDVTLTGNIAIDDSEGATAALTTTAGADIIVGTNPYTAAAASIIGTNINLDANSYLAVYAGSSIPEKMIEDKDLKFTVFMLNGAKYLTAYVTAAGAANVIAISAAAVDDAVINKVVKIEGFDMANMTDATKWKDAEGNALVAGQLVASSPVMTFDGVSYNARVLVSSVTGVSVFVDGVRYDSGTTIDGVKVGTHTVSVTINPGYKGTTATTFNGKSVTSSFEVTPDMTGAAPAAVVLSITGDISIDTGDGPQPTPEEKSEWTITTILLVVLIILIAVMVIVVLLRMNRS